MLRVELAAMPKIGTADVGDAAERRVAATGSIELTSIIEQLAVARR